MQKKLLSIAMGFITLGMASSASAAFIEQVTQTSTLTFSQPTSALNLVINPVAGLTAGAFQNGAQLANITVTQTASTDLNHIGLRWTPGIANQVVESSRQAVVLGDTSATNQLKAIISFTGVAGSDVASPAGGPYYVTTPTVNTLNAQILTQGNQNIAADTYPISLDAAVYIP
ncbi:Saf-pilin pilus formation protein [Kosakonia arachidis]|uniref:Saf-pilin pilus formation protein n=1 Tax=Kosakonia arachidis TaxID=551989 RepID=A0A1I7E9P2_9ENTR|nr:hypothetical protein [Kosakonia arachidis]SFU20605.1 Saf-pilin pilus formation protein [Kosakonia arachidis]